MLNNMLTYSTAMLSAVSDFLQSEPMIYIIGLLAVAVVIRIFIRLFGRA